MTVAETLIALLLLCLLVLTPLFGLSPMAGALIEIGLKGGHGTPQGWSRLLRRSVSPDPGSRPPAADRRG